MDVSVPAGACTAQSSFRAGLFLGTATFWGMVLGR